MLKRKTVLRAIFYGGVGGVPNMMKCVIPKIACIITYGFQIWLPGTEIFKLIVGVKQPRSTMCNITSDPLERLHLSFLKWSIGVSKQTSNAAVYGDCGRKPTIIQIIKQFVDFLNRLTLLDRNDSQSIVRHAFAEQKRLNLPWYTNTVQLSVRLDPRLSYIVKGRSDVLPNALLCKTNTEKWFKGVWSSECKENRKLRYYSHIKKDIGLEPYVAHCRHDITKAIARLRTSSHRLNVETGRYGNKSLSLHNKC